MTRDTWKLVGERMRELDLVRLDELAAALADPDGTFADLPEPVRTAALDELETAFCDPAGVLTAAATAPPPLRQLRQGQAFGDYAAKVRAGANGTDVEPAITELRAKVEAFAGLTAVDWALPPAAISDGEPGAAIAAVQDGYRVDTVQDWDAQADPEPDPLIGYRDYLRNLWVDGDDEYDTILANRFHQDFHTSSLERRPLNEILIPVLRRALVAPAGAGHGLGLDPATVPERPSGQPARTYLDTLVTLSGISATELGLRYRIDLTRPDTALSTEVEVNIATIRGFFADDFQSVDPHSIIHKDLQGKAPFYLQFDEWRRQFGPFFPENHYQVASCVPIGAGADPERAERLRQFPPSTGLAAPLRESWLRFIELRSAQWVFQEGLKAFGRLEYGLARNRFAEVQGMIYRFRPSDTTAQAKLTERQQAVVGNWRELANFESRDQAGTLPSDDLDVFRQWDSNLSSPPPPQDVREARAEQILRMELYAIPSMLGDIALAMGDYSEAIRQYGRITAFRVGTAEIDARAVYAGRLDYMEHTFSWLRRFPLDVPYLYQQGDLPYSVDIHQQTPPPSQPRLIHPVDLKSAQLRQANAMLEWADVLYRTDEPDNIARARELYKGVLFIHGEHPPISPSWDPAMFRFRLAAENPARAAQLQRARLALLQIAAGLNFIGYADDTVPLLRYRTLADAARDHAALAKSVEGDLLKAMGRIEDLIIEQMTLLNLRQKAALQGRVAEEQSKIAANNARIAGIQLGQVKDLIAAKKREIEDHDSFLGQVGDFVGHVMDSVDGLPGDTKDSVGAGFQSGVMAKEMAGSGMLGLGAGGAIMAGFGIFAVVSVMALNSMTSEANGRRAELAALQTQVLPVAELQVDSRNREQVIAGLQGEIAQADARLAASLLEFNRDRVLNIDFWVACATLSRRILRRYLELGATTAWLAERALAYEQNRPLRIVKLDYFPARTIGVTGADRLHLDLTELEAARLAGLGRTVPVRHTFSLARDFPLRFAQLKATGRCTFRTDEAVLRAAYPGTFGFRIKAVTITPSDLALRGPFRGTLRNLGVSTISTAIPGVTRTSVRPPDALPMSEFRLREDMDVFGLPDESLHPFEGSGFDTLWELELPPGANPQGLAALNDVLISFDTRAEFSVTALPASPATVKDGLVLASGKRLDPEGFKDFVDGIGRATLRFDAEALRLPAKETAKIANVLLMLCGDEVEDPVKATLRADESDVSAPVKFVANVARSNGPPLAATGTPASPLNTLIGKPAGQTFVLTLDRLLGPDLDGISDIVLGIEYVAG